MDPEFFAEATKMIEELNARIQRTRTRNGEPVVSVRFDKEPALALKNRIIDAHPELPSMINKVFYGNHVEDSCYVVIQSAMKSHFKTPTHFGYDRPLDFTWFIDVYNYEKFFRYCTYSTPGIDGDPISQLATFANIMKMSEGLFFPSRLAYLSFDELDFIPSTPEVERCAFKFWNTLDIYVSDKTKDHETRDLVFKACFELDEACREALQQMLSVHTKSASKT